MSSLEKKKKTKHYELTFTITVIVYYSIWNTVDFFVKKDY